MSAQIHTARHMTTTGNDAEMTTATDSILLTHAVGLHARPSVKVTKLAKTFGLTVHEIVVEWGRAVAVEQVKAALDAQKPFTALYVGGMGAKSKNFHKEMMARRGYPEAAEKIQELFLAGRKREAADAVPDEYIDEACLVGTPDRIKERFQAWVDTGISGMTITTSQAHTLEVMADIAELPR